MKMKKLLNSLLAGLVMTVVLFSCDSEDPGPTITAPEGKIVATIDGTSFEADGGAQLYNDEIMLGGNSGNASISVIVTKSAAVGTYEVKGAALGVTTPDAQINYTPDGSTLFSSSFATDGEVVGTVTITEVDETNKTISGTFSGKVVLDGTTKEVASGSFNKIPYTSTPPGSMSAKIDGVDFDASVVVAQHMQGLIMVNGQALNGSKIIVLSFGDDITVGTHSIESIGSDIYATYTASLSSFVSSEGTLTITKHDKSAKRVEGTFSFEAEPFIQEGETHVITAGTFAVSYN
jgi:hypothetical protein